MGQYKVPQDVETEDKILGPLSIKQFIYVIIALLWAFLMWRIFSSVIILAVIFAFPVTGFFLLLGFGQREGVPFEDYVVAFIRFLTVPRKRIWIKDDSPEVIVDAPVEKKTDEFEDKNVSVGQLKQLASIIDTRGNFKDPSVQLPEDDLNEADVYAQRIIGPAQVGTTTNAASAGVIATQATSKNDDVLDETSLHAAQVGQMLQSAEQASKQAAVAQMKQALSAPQQAQAQPSAPTTQQAMATQTANELAKSTANLTVQKVAARAREQSQQLSAGSTVQLRQS